MIKNNLDKIFIKDVKKISNNIPSPEQVQDALLTILSYSTWESFQNSLRFGQCNKICALINKMFNKCKIYSVEEKFSDIAIEQLHNVNDCENTVGTHFIIKIKNVFYDFAKGTNKLFNIYLIKSINSNDEMFNVNLSEFELSHFSKIEEVKNIYEIR